MAFLGGLEHECPGADDEGVVGIEHGDGRIDADVADRSGGDAVANLEVLELGMDAGGGVAVLDVVDADVSLEPVVAVETAAAVADLHEPWPNRLGWGLDGDRPGVVGHGVVGDVVAGQGHGSFCRG